jgi:glycosyltransferase involved in cell wall biosynthesis
MARVLRDEGYAVDIVTFNSLVPGKYDAGQGIQIVEIGQYHKQPILQRMGLWRKFYSVVEHKVREQPALIISYCSFSFLCAEAKKKNIPHAYIALEVNARPETFDESPFTFLRIRRTFRQLDNAEFIATPSIQRSAWLAGKCGLKNIPYTIQNTAYYTERIAPDKQIIDELIPPSLRGKTTILYTGSINDNYKIKEIASAFNKLDNDAVALIINGFRDADTYCMELAELIETLPQKNNILLLPAIPREQLVALQRYANIGVCFMQESDSQLSMQMAAPNKVGEYIANGLYLLTNSIPYTNQFIKTGIATVIDEPTVYQISVGMQNALEQVNTSGMSERIHSFFREEYCMQKQSQPIVNFLKLTQL